MGRHHAGTTFYDGLPKVSSKYSQTSLVERWGAIMLEPHFMMDFQRHHFQQLG
jgi:hypothetical protein